MAFTPPQQDLANLQVKFTDLKAGSGATMPATAIRCFNLGGNDFVGHHFEKKVSVAKGKVQALWLGVQVPRDAIPGAYEGRITVKPQNAEAAEVKLSLAVSGEILEDHGDGELWRLARLRWLDSSIGINDDVAKPYTPVKVGGNSVSCLGRTVFFGSTGLPRSIKSNDIEVLAKPMELAVETASGASQWSGGKIKVLKSTPGSVYTESTSSSGALTMTSRSKMEFDGYINYRLTVKASKPVDITNIRLEIPMRRAVSTYLMGLGAEGGYRPRSWQWDWNAKGKSAVWIGEVKAGLYCILKSGPDVWDIGSAKAQIASEAWKNGGNGGFTVSETGEQVIQRAFAGPRTLNAGEEIDLRFGILATPVKPLNPDHWNQRYYQFYSEVVSPAEAQKRNATIVTIHQGNELNPYINYPFLTVDKMKAYVDDAHSRGMRAKIYYTVRELSNRCAEIWALRSLGNEVFLDGTHDGDAWLHEHLVDNYAEGWHQAYPNGEVDAAIGNTGLSRWHNYYLEGIAWLGKNLGIDGIYLDGVAYGREGMKRMRKVLDVSRPGGLYDLHEGDNFKYLDGRVSPALDDLELMPFLDSLWLGEIYDYQNSSPDYWLVELSGIPFGLYGDMLQMPINPWRGMLFGMTGRYWSGADPQHIWKFWKDFGLQDSQMIGWWDPACPVWTGHKDVLATVYRKEKQSLIAVGSWAREAPGAWAHWPSQLRLRVDWKALGLDPAKVKLYAPRIPDFQEQATFTPNQEIPVDFGKGWLLIALESS